MSFWKAAYKFLAALIFVVSVNITVAESSYAQEKQQKSYLVKAGDTLFSISKKLGVSISELKEWNNLSDNSLKVDQQLIYFDEAEEKVRVVTDEEEDLGMDAGESLMSIKPTQSNTFYIVKSGDSLYKIAGEFGMTIQQLRNLNNLKSDVLSIGQRLTVNAPASAVPNVSEFSDESSPQGKYVLYTIGTGELLDDILDKFKMTEQEFSQLNPEIDIRRLALGQKVTVLLPPSRLYDNPYLPKADLEDLGLVPVMAYADEERGKATTSGELYNPDELTAAHSNIAMGSLIFIENPENGRGIYVRINDRTTGEGLKLSGKAYELLVFNPRGQKSVTIFIES
jgi:LysM repeat protein